jgi:triosephosphate isomerase
MNIISQIERDNYFKGLENSLSGRDFKNVKIVLCPPAIHLESFKKNIKNVNVFFGSQNIHTEINGRFTGEISAPMIKNFGGDFVIIGHSERRIYFNETNELIGKKMKIAIESNLTPIICIGETKDERETGRMKEIIIEQLMEGLAHVPITKLEKIIITYEPIWAIGSGKTPSGNDVMEARILMQKTLSDKFGLDLDKMPKIIYGGSVEYRNVKEICIDAGMDGVLVGGESLHPIDFIKIGEALENN